MIPLDHNYVAEINFNGSPTTENSPPNPALVNSPWLIVSGRGAASVHTAGHSDIDIRETHLWGIS